MHDHLEKYCPRCKQAFACKLGNITQCQCYGIVVSAEMKSLIEQRYNDCLCADCLRHLQKDPDRFRE
jgi:hypothetical protein